MDLAEFLLARIDEDKAVARAVQDEHEMWDWDSYMSSAGWYDGSAHKFAQRFDPVRVLADCEARRRIVEAESNSRVLHDMVGDIEVHSWSDEGAIVTVNGEHMTTEEFNAVFTEPAPASKNLRLLALPYAGHPDYQQEWKP